MWNLFSSSSSGLPRKLLSRAGNHPETRFIPQQSRPTCGVIVRSDFEVDQAKVEELEIHSSRLSRFAFCVRRGTWASARAPSNESLLCIQPVTPSLPAAWIIVRLDQEVSLCSFFLFLPLDLARVPVSPSRCTMHVHRAAPRQTGN